MSKTGQVAILFADISGSTRLYERLGDVKARRVVGECLERLTRIVQFRGGRVVKTIGDEVMCVFAKADPVVEAACAMQEAVADERFDGERLSLRIGLHFGPVVVEGQDVFGDAVNIAARMVAQARAEQIITTRETIDRLPPELVEKTRHLYQIEVKGKSVPVDLFEVLWQSEHEFELTRVMSAPVFAAIQEERPTTLRLTYCGREIALGSDQGQFQIGRGPSNDLAVDDPSASRVHARIEYRRGKYVLVDQSTNGTFVLTDDGRHVPLRREEFILLGAGRISFGREAWEEQDHPLGFRVEG